jgi:hypothetical protein
VILACSVAAAAPSLIPTLSGRRLVMPRLRLQRFRSCSSSQGAGVVGSFMCRVLSCSRRAGPTSACSRRRSRRASSQRF